jgi:hypothetical protein
MKLLTNHLVQIKRKKHQRKVKQKESDKSDPVPSTSVIRKLSEGFTNVSYVDDDDLITLKMILKMVCLQQIPPAPDEVRKRDSLVLT